MSALPRNEKSDEKGRKNGKKKFKNLLIIGSYGVVEGLK
jgi:hypothetical protein